MAFVWERSVEGDKYWRGFYDKLRAMTDYGTNDGKPWVDPKESPKPIELPDSVLRLIAIGLSAQNVVLHGHDFDSNDLAFIDDHIENEIAKAREYVAAELFAETSNPTSDSKPTADEPVIPTGYRMARQEECVRNDVKFWDNYRSEWNDRTFQGVMFDGFGTIYIVPVDRELTDEDAEQRRLVMYRDYESDGGPDFWHGPLRLIWVKDDGSESKYVMENLQSYKQARLATPEEIEKSGVLNKP